MLQFHWKDKKNSMLVRHLFLLALAFLVFSSCFLFLLFIVGVVAGNGNLVLAGSLLGTCHVWIRMGTNETDNQKQCFRVNHAIVRRRSQARSLRIIPAVPWFQIFSSPADNRIWIFLSSLGFLKWSSLICHWLTVSKPIVSAPDGLKGVQFGYCPIAIDVVVDVVAVVVIVVMQSVDVSDRRD